MRIVCTDTFKTGSVASDKISMAKQTILIQISGKSNMTSYEVYFLNAPDNASKIIALSGHASLLFAADSTDLELYNFSPRNNKTPFARGAIAQTVDKINSFDSFVASCKANNFEGIPIQNGFKTWYEPYKRAIKLGVTTESFNKIYTYAQTIKKDPPRFNFFTGYNCTDFCLGALKCGDVYFENAQGEEIVRAFPNVIYELSVRARNVTTFEKIDFRE